MAAGASSDGALVIQQLASGNLGADTSCVLTSPAGGGIFNAAQADVGNTEIGLKQNSAGTATVGSILFDYFGTPPPTTVQGALDGNLNQCATLSGAPLKRQAWAHIFTLTGLPTFAR